MSKAEYNKQNEENIISCSISSILEGDVLWMLSNYSNTLLKFDWESKELIEIYPIPEKVFPLYAHIQMIKIHKDIFIIPYKGVFMYKFDIEHEIFEEIEIPLSDEEKKIECKFSSKIVLEYQGTICLLGQKIKGIFFYDVVSKSFKRELSHIDYMQKRGDDISNLNWNDFYQEQENIYLTIFQYNCICCINMKTKRVEMIELCADKEIHLSTITKWENNFLLTTDSDEKIIWSKKLGIEKFIVLNNLANKHHRYYRKVFHVNNKNYYFAACERKIFMEKEGFHELMFDAPTGCRYPEGYTQYETIFRENDKIYFQMRENGMIYQLNTLKDNIESVELKIPTIVKEQLKNRSFLFMKDLMIAESEVYTLIGWINNLVI